MRRWPGKNLQERFQKEHVQRPSLEWLPGARVSRKRVVSETRWKRWLEGLAGRGKGWGFST